MEFPNLGKNCSMKSCSELDFLPIQCQNCGLPFCSQHASPEIHSCTSALKVSCCQKENDIKLHYSCQLQGCTNWELAPVICTDCKRNFCLKHRQQADHGCTAFISPTNSMQEAALKIQTIVDSMASAPAKKQGRKSDGMAAKVQLMKLKQKAVGNNNIPQEERIYFRVILPKSHQKSAEVIVFVSTQWAVGHVIDAVADIAKVKNENNVPSAPKLMLFRRSDGFCLRAMDTKVSSLIDLKEIHSGQTLIMEYTTSNIFDNLLNFEEYDQ